LPLFYFFILCSTAKYKQHLYMKTLKLLLALSSILGLTACDNQISLFNGKNLDGWTCYLADATPTSSVYSVKDGAINIKGNPFGYIHTDKKYSNFKLQLKWRYVKEEGNSGIFVFVQDEKKIWPNAIECQLMKGRNGDFVLLGGSDIAEFKTPEGTPRPKFPVVKRFCDDGIKPAGQWNTADIVCKDGTIEVKMNGILKNKGTKSMHKTGYIALQSEGAEIEFKDIKLTPIK
jgi:hypothetical protein